MNKWLLILCIGFFGGFNSLPAAGQVNNLIQQAEAYKKAFKDEDALKKYLEVVKIQPGNVAALCSISELYNVLGKRLKEKEDQKDYYRKGKDFAARAIKADPNNSEANFAMAVSMGRMALMYSGEEKIKAVKEVKTYADKCIQIDPANFKGYHVLGKWHYEISRLTSLERWLVKVAYGSLPKSSYDEAAKNYEKSMQLNPSFLLNYLELAKVYKEKGDKQKARNLVNQMLKMPLVTSDDSKIKSLGKELLNDL